MIDECQHCSSSVETLTVAIRDHSRRSFIFHCREESQVFLNSISLLHTDTGFSQQPFSPFSGGQIYWSWQSGCLIWKEFGNSAIYYSKTKDGTHMWKQPSRYFIKKPNLEKCGHKMENCSEHYSDENWCGTSKKTLKCQFLKLIIFHFLLNHIDQMTRFGESSNTGNKHTSCFWAFSRQDNSYVQDVGNWI